MRHMRIFILLLGGLFVVLFQNCGPSSFQAITSDNTSVIDLGSTQNPLPPDGDDPGGDLPVTPPSPEIPVPPEAGSYLLSVAKSGSGSITSTPLGINCGPDCSQAFAKDASVVLIAQASSGSVFKGWSGACSGTGQTCTVKMSTIKNVSVNFEPTSLDMSIDAVIAAMPRNSWKALPATQMKDACPTPYSAYACTSVIGAWSGGAYDEKRDRMVVIGGGHNDSWYNNVFAFDLGSMQWMRLTEMPADSAQKAPEHWRDIRVESCGFYPKGPLNIPADFMKGNYVDISKCQSEAIASQLDFQQPRSTHTYQRVYVDRVQDLYCYIPLGTFPSAQTSTDVVMCLNPKTGLWSQMANRPTNVVGRGQTALDSQGQVWAITASSGPIGVYSPTLNAWKTYGSLNSNAGGTTDIDRKRDQLYVLFPLTAGGYSLRQFDLTNPTSLSQKTPYTEVAVSGQLPPDLGQRPGFVYRDDDDQFYAWGGGKSIYTFNPITKAWSQTSPTGDDPGAQSSWGTYGRFRYSANRGVFVLVNSTTQNVFIYKP